MTPDATATAARPQVLALNGGSSSLKFGLYAFDDREPDRVLEGSSDASVDPREAIDRIAALIAASGHAMPTAIGHRIVHGGPWLQRHAVIDDAVLADLAAAVPFAPLHTPAALALVWQAKDAFPGLPQVACFDTVFHAAMPPEAATLPLPSTLQAEGIRRYGFHGLSCESIVQQLGGQVPSRLLIAHLGNGASITAVRDGVSVATTMGLTPGGGLVMGTRSGDIDPGVLVWLLREKGLDAAALEDLVDRRSGLLGISGLSGDMRVLHAAGASHEGACLAIRMFCSAVAGQLAALCTVLGGVDLIVFTGGIGENDAAVREDIVVRLVCIGIGADVVRVLPSREDEQIARHVQAVLASAATRRLALSTWEDEGGGAGPPAPPEG